MKRYFSICIIIICFTACNGSIKVNEKEIEDAGEKLQQTVEKGVDTLGSKLKKLKDKINDKIDTLQAKERN